MPYILRDARVRYDYAKFRPVMAFESGAVVYLQQNLGVADTSQIAKLKGQTLRFGSQGPTSLDMVALWAFRMLGLEVRPVFGMQGSGPKRLAFERGETQIDMQTSPGYIDHVQDRERKGEVVPLWSWGILDEAGNLQRDPSFPHLPHFGEAYQAMHGKPPGGRDFEIMKALIAAGYGAEKFLFLPEGTPEPMVEAWRQAAARVVQDPDFKKKAPDVMGEYGQVIGRDAERVLAVAASLDDESRKAVVDWLKAKFNYKPE